MMNFFYGFGWGDGASCAYVIYSRPWAPDEPVCEWMVPGTYEEDE
jgi:hypothetical protein